jgi:hypothetical protein
VTQAFWYVKAYGDRWLSWQTFTLSRPLQPSIWLLRCLRPPSRELAFSLPLAGSSSMGVPQFQHERRECPVAACSTPGGSGTTSARFLARHCPHRPVWVRCVNHFHLLLVTTPHTQVPRVSIGHRTGRSTTLWLAVAELLSAGFRPQGVPPRDACCVVLVPLSMNGSSWSNLSHR